jgi:hypothetical protein
MQLLTPVLLRCRPGFLPAEVAVRFSKCRRSGEATLAAGAQQPAECRDVYRLLEMEQHRGQGEGGGAGGGVGPS